MKRKRKNSVSSARGRRAFIRSTKKEYDALYRKRYRLELELEVVD